MAVLKSIEQQNTFNLHTVFNFYLNLAKLIRSKCTLKSCSDESKIAEPAKRASAVILDQVGRPFNVLPVGSA